MQEIGTTKSGSFTYFAHFKHPCKMSGAILSVQQCIQIGKTALEVYIDSFYK